MPIGRAANGWIFRSTPPDCEVGGHSLGRSVILLVWFLAATSTGGVRQVPPSPRSARVQHLVSVIAPAESALVGTIERFEEAARRLILQTKDAHVPFIVAPDAIVRLGSRTLPIADLAAHRGRKAKVRYTQTEGRRTAHWVVISSEPPRSAP